MFYDEAVHSAFDAFALSTSYVLFTLFMLVLDIFSRQFSAQPSISSGETFQYFIQGATFFFLVSCILDEFSTDMHGMISMNNKTVKCNNNTVYRVYF